MLGFTNNEGVAESPVLALSLTQIMLVGLMAAVGLVTGVKYTCLLGLSLRISSHATYPAAPVKLSNTDGWSAVTVLGLVDTCKGVLHVPNVLVALTVPEPDHLA